MSCKYVDSCPPPVHHVNVAITMPPLCIPSLKGVSRRCLDSISRKFGKVYPAHTWKVYLAILKGICLANTWTTYLANLGKLYLANTWWYILNVNLTVRIASISPSAIGTLRTSRTCPACSAAPRASTRPSAWGALNVTGMNGVFSGAENFASPSASGTLRTSRTWPACSTAPRASISPSARHECDWHGHGAFIFNQPCGQWDASKRHRHDQPGQ